MLIDVASIITNLAVLAKHCDTVLDSGGIFALLGLLSEKRDEAVAARPSGHALPHSDSQSVNPRCPPRLAMRCRTQTFKHQPPLPPPLVWPCIAALRQ